MPATASLKLDSAPATMAVADFPWGSYRCPRCVAGGSVRWSREWRSCVHEQAGNGTVAVADFCRQRRGGGTAACCLHSGEVKMSREGERVSERERGREWRVRGGIYTRPTMVGTRRRCTAATRCTRPGHGRPLPARSESAEADSVQLRPTDGPFSLLYYS